MEQVAAPLMIIFLILAFLGSIIVGAFVASVFDDGNGILLPVAVFIIWVALTGGICLSGILSILY